ncbi:hypothetical protein F0919_09375 [Taibaiella lutea]|uniref:Addiction module protein n=1 Tax=Taibaiella lutea TaxID=2608001 RepID=A0A5M6CHV8_9BACT|nr:hypothetical protein [Taibaiella lutea]KAA5534808.1 hypothetical protein F0919_09375 [Taibaiella lutea]
MDTAMIKEQLHNYIERADDKHLEAIYVLLEKEIDTDALRKELIQKERAKYLNGEEKSYSPEEVKAMALNKSERDAI